MESANILALGHCTILCNSTMLYCPALDHQQDIQNPASLEKSACNEEVLQDVLQHTVLHQPRHAHVGKHTGAAVEACPTRPLSEGTGAALQACPTRALSDSLSQQLPHPQWQ